MKYGSILQGSHPVDSTHTLYAGLQHHHHPEVELAELCSCYHNMTRLVIIKAANHDAQILNYCYVMSYVM
uniref:Uncharacterized protein n=1 Tax=Arion vulgaris TaxID=1028688 RepID=A0A0B6YMQ7_9EUPU